MSVIRVNEPVSATVATDAHGRPQSISVPRKPVRTVQSIAEQWTIDDRWWTDEPIKRTYYQCEMAGGVNLIVFLDELSGAWYVQR